MDKVVDISSESGQVERLRSFISEKDRGDGFTPLQYASKGSKWGVVNLFLDKTTNKVGLLFRSNGDQSSTNWTTMHYAAVYNGDLNLVEDVLELLPNKETIVNARDSRGWTPLHYAVYYNRPKIVAFLIDINADIDAETSTGKTVSQMIGNNESEVAKILFISQAINKRELDEAKLLLSQHAPRSKVEVKGKNKYSGTWTFLHYAVYSGNVDLFGDLFQLFLNESDGNIDAKDERGWTPLHYAAYYGERGMIDFLISKEAEVNARDNSRNTPLHIAAKKGNYYSVEVLLENGADINAKNNQGKTPLNLARKRDLSEVVKLLQERRSEQRASHIRHKRHKQYHREHLQEGRRGGATSGASKPFSWINGSVNECISQVKALASSTANTIVRWFTASKDISGSSERSYSSATKNNLKAVDFSQIDVNGTIMLLDLLIRKITVQKYISTVDQPIPLFEARGYALNITTEFERVLKDTAERSGISTNKSSFDFLEIYKAVSGKMISGELSKIPTILYSAIEEAYPKNEKFLSILKGNIEKMLDGQQIVNNRNSSNQMQNTIGTSGKMPLSSLNSIAIEPLNGKKGVTCAGRVA